MYCKFIFAFCVALLATFATASPSPKGYVLHEKRDIQTHPKSWVKRSAVKHDDSLIPIRIGMAQSNLDRGEELLMEVADPKSPKFGQWYTSEEIVHLFAPSQHAVNKIRDWLEEAGVKNVSHSANKQWIQFDATTKTAEHLFKTKYYTYEHLPTKHKRMACDEYHLPPHIAEHVDYITPGLRLIASNKPSSHKDRSSRKNHPGKPNKRGTIRPRDQNATCDQAITPSCIATMYNITHGTLAAPGNELGIFTEGDVWDPYALEIFLTEYAPNIPNTTTPIIKSIDGNVFADDNEGIAMAGMLELSYPIIWPQNSKVFLTDDTYYEALPYSVTEAIGNTFLDALDGSYCTSCSYGECGNNATIDPNYPDPNNWPDPYTGQLQCGVFKPTNVILMAQYWRQEHQLPTNYLQRQCAEFMKLGMQGISVVAEAGDDGVSGTDYDSYRFPHGCLGKHGEVYNPSFPASCPWVTTVGSTILPENSSAQGDNEIADFIGGGGFSNIFTTPSYQKHSVANYLDFLAKNYNVKSYVVNGTNYPTEQQTLGGHFNRIGRGYPDVSAVSENIAVYVLDYIKFLDWGSHDSAAIFAAILNRINEERLHVGKKTVGFVNPTLFAHPWGFHDITNNSDIINSPPDSSTCGKKGLGWKSTTGWDPLTGLGTPNYSKLLKIYMKLP